MRLSVLKRLFRARRPDPARPAALLLERVARPGQHERRIAGLLGAGNVAFCGSEPVFDFPLVLLGFANRSGSTLLAEYLRQSGVVHGLGEFSNFEFVRNKSLSEGLETFPGLIAHLEKNRGACPLFGLKVSWEQLAMLIRWNIPAMFSGVRLVHVYRRNALDRAVSMSIASQTRQWASTQKGSGVTPVLEPGEIDALIRLQAQEDVLLRLVAEAFELPYHRVSYEDLCADPAPVLRAILKFCDHPRPGWQPRPPKLRRQAGPANAAFRSGYLQELRAGLLAGGETDCDRADRP